MFFCNFKLRNLLPKNPPPAPTNKPNPPAVNAIVPVLTGSNVSLKSIS